ncbi:MAG: hypothetical protein QNJ14_11770 [Woeseiaceae bacterium]|nr:hypothetical protein [Woeseiaceae bacterium]
MKTPIPALVLSLWALCFFGLAISESAYQQSYSVALAVIALPASIGFAKVLRALFGSPRDVLLAGATTAIIGLAALWRWKAGDLSLDRTLFSLTPFYQLTVVAVSFQLFLRAIKRPPQDVVLDFSVGKGPDRVFFILVSLLLILVPMLTIVEFRPQ